MIDDLSSRKAAIDWLKNEWDGMVVHVFDGIKNIPFAHCDNCPYPDQHVPQEDAVSRKALKDIFEAWLKVEGYSEGELNMLKAVLYEITVMPPAQPELIEKAAYIRGFEQGRTQGMIDAQERKK